MTVRIGCSARSPRDLDHVVGELLASPRRLRRRSRSACRRALSLPAGSRRPCRRPASCVRDRDDRQVLVDQRDRAVLHLARRIALGVDVRDLLQLQRAFERDRVDARRGRGRGSPARCEYLCASSSICFSCFEDVSILCGIIAQLVHRVADVVARRRREAARM